MSMVAPAKFYIKLFFLIEADRCSGANGESTVDGASASITTGD
jgi:hypothetical protein